MRIVCWTCLNGSLEPEVRPCELPVPSISGPFPKRQRAGAVQDLADISLIHGWRKQRIHDGCHQAAKQE